MLDRPRRCRQRRGCPILDPARDPFADTVLDYAYNLAASDALLIPDQLLLSHPTPGERRLLAVTRNSETALAEAVGSADG